MIKFFEFKESDLDPIKSFYIKDHLNKKVFDGFEIDKKIREDLLKIGKDFFDTTDIESDVVDIALCGSLCNYNWSDKYSDFDLHIIINYKDIDDGVELAERYCDYAKKIWNNNHDIKIKGFEVEVAIQDEKDLEKSIGSGRMGGVYSLLNDKWIKKPKKEDFEPDEKIISKKAISIMEKIDDIKNEIEKSEYKEFDEKITKVWTKIKDLRKSGLDSEGGEYSIGNLVFKLLRRNGYISTIMDLKKYKYDSQFESTSDELDNMFYSLEKLSHEFEQESEESWSLSLTYEHDIKNKIIKIEYSCYGYSQGWGDTMEVYYDETPIKVINFSEGGGGEIGNFKNKRIEYYRSLSEIVDDIKKEYGHD
jgi:hypothetical protein